MIDLRSDTVTKPSAAMRQAMAAAEVGDDVYGEDPTVNRLQERVAELLGKERALFVPSGTMANQSALKAATQPGDEVICDRGAHVAAFEGGMPAAFSGLMLYLLDCPRGLIAPEQVAAALRPADHHYPRSRVVELEITSNRGGGSIYPIEQVRAIVRVAREHGLWLHLDGARLWNASVATGIPPKTWAAEFDAVCVCLSKGLGAPVGSLVAGSADFIDRVHRVRKMLGGGMRQAGLLAAAGLYALDHNRERLADDHANAKRLAQGLADLPAVGLDPADVETNIVIFDLLGRDAKPLAAECKARGLLIHAIGPRRIRLVTHLDVSRAQCEEALAILRELLRN
jgi:threonine aldolase